MTRSIIGAYNVFGARPVFGADPSGQGGCNLATPLTQDGVYDPGQAAAIQAMLAARGSALVTDCPPNMAREQYLGFVAIGLDPGAVGTLVATSTWTFKPHRLTIPSDIAGSLAVLNIFIGNLPQMVNAGGSGVLPGRVFSEFSTDQVINFDTLQISQQMTVQVQNIGLARIDPITAAAKGVMVR